MEYAPILMVFAFAAVVGGALIGLPHLLAPRRLTPVKESRSSAGRTRSRSLRGGLPSSSRQSGYSSSSSISRSSSSSSGRCSSTSSAGSASSRCWCSSASSCSASFIYGERVGSSGSRFVLHVPPGRGHRLGPEILDLPVPVRHGVLRHGVHGHGLLALRHRPLRRRPASLLAPPGGRALRRRHHQPQDGARAEAHLRPDDRAEVGGGFRCVHVHGWLLRQLRH